jgi:hypothetical protein
MSKWRKKAIEFLPDYKNEIERMKNPMALWIEMSIIFDKAFISTNKREISNILRFASWCKSEKSGVLPNDTSTAVIVAFYEDLPCNKIYWQYFKKWFTPKEFEELLPYFDYHLEENEIEELKKVYCHKKKSQ